MEVLTLKVTPASQIANELKSAVSALQKARNIADKAMGSDRASSMVGFASVSAGVDKAVREVQQLESQMRTIHEQAVKDSK